MLWGIQTYSFFQNLCVKANNLRDISLKSEQFKILTPVQIWNELWPLKIWKPNIGDASSYTFLESLWQDKQYDTIFREIKACLNFLTHVELSRSTVTILEMPQYVAYQKYVAYALYTLSTKSPTFNRYCTKMPLSCA